MATKKTSTTTSQATAKRKAAKRPAAKKIASRSTGVGAEVLSIDRFIVVFGSTTSEAERAARIAAVKQFITKLEEADVISVCEKPGGA